MNQSLNRRRITSTSSQTSLKGLRTSKRTVVEDEHDPLKGEDVQMIKVAPTTEVEDGLSDDFGTGLR